MYDLVDLQSKFKERDYVFLGIVKTNKNQSHYSYQCNKHLDKGVLTIRPSSFNIGAGCKFCGYIKRAENTKVTTDSFKTKVYELVKNEYIVLGEYTLANNSILMKHNVCNKEYNVTPGHFVDGSRCPYCAGKNRDTEQFKKEIYDLVGDEYTLIGEYVSTRDKLLMKHNVCNKTYEVNPNKFLQNRRCPNCSDCNNSYLSIEIEMFLLSYKIEYIREFTFKDCKHKQVLPFDFAIFKDNKLICLIEADGSQHEKASSKFGGEKQLALTKFRDDIKDKYCLDNNINLIRINHYQVKGVKPILLYKLKELIVGITPIVVYPNNVTRGIQPKDIITIREMYYCGVHSSLSLSELFKVSKQTILSILHYDMYSTIGIEYQDIIEKRLSRKTTY